MGIHKGAKLTDTPKDRTLKFRFDAEIDAKLEYICKITSKTKSKVIRDGIEKQYAELNRKDSDAP